MEVPVHELGNHVSVSGSATFPSPLSLPISTLCLSMLARQRREVAAIEILADDPVEVEAIDFTDELTLHPPIHQQPKAFTDNLMRLKDSCDLFPAREEPSQLGVKPQSGELFQKLVGNGNEEMG